MGRLKLCFFDGGGGGGVIYINIFLTYKNNRKSIFLHGKIKPIFMTYRYDQGLGVP